MTSLGAEAQHDMSVKFLHALALSKTKKPCRISGRAFSFTELGFLRIHTARIDT